MDQYRYCTIKTTCKDENEAQSISELLLRDRLVFCAQFHKIQSVYFWNNEIRNDQEILLSLKARSSDYKAIQKALIENHSYDLPQIIQIPIIGGSEGYFNWADDSIVNS